MKLTLVKPDKSTDDLLADLHERLDKERRAVALLVDRVQALLRALDVLEVAMAEQKRELDRLRLQRLS